MEPIVDIHAHLGDILYPGGGELLGRAGVKKHHWFEFVSISEWFLHRLAADDTYYGMQRNC